MGWEREKGQRKKWAEKQDTEEEVNSWKEGMETNWKNKVLNTEWNNPAECAKPQAVSVVSTTNTEESEGGWYLNLLAALQEGRRKKKMNREREERVQDIIKSLQPY